MTRKQGPCNLPSRTVPALLSLRTASTAGTPYTRRADVEAEILAALSLPQDQWLAYMPLKGGWQNETRVHLLRSLRDPSQADLFGKILDTLMRRVEPAIERWSRGFTEVDLECIKTDVGETIVERILDKRPTRKAEFVEVSIATVIKNETLKAVGYRRVRSHVNLMPPDKRAEDGAYVDPVLEIADDRPNPFQNLMEKNRPKFQQILMAVKNPLHRQAFILFHLRKWPYHAKDPGEPSLCNTFHRSDRQIRTWIETARADMEKFLGESS